jgi:hypothetical protein
VKPRANSVTTRAIPDLDEDQSGGANAASRCFADIARFTVASRGQQVRILRNGSDRRRWRVMAVAFAAIGCAVGCVGSSQGEADYQHKAVATTEHVRSSVRTVELAVQTAAEGDDYGPYLSRVISQAEDDASSAANAFDTIQPPGETSDEVRDQVDELTQQALDVLSKARIAIRRGDVGGLVQLSSDLTAAGDQLEQFGESEHV